MTIPHNSRGEEEILDAQYVDAGGGSTALVGPSGPAALLRYNPAKTIEDAGKAARALIDLISQKPDNKKVMFGGEQYLEFPDWQTVARFYGLTARIDGPPKYVEFPGRYGGEPVVGFRAYASAVLTLSNGQQVAVSTADAMCLTDEEKWDTRPKYAMLYCWRDGRTETAEEPPRDQMVWEDNPFKSGKKRPKKMRVHVSDEPVPLFQLNSMAQTRALAKALRNCCSWVVEMAGYRTTPAEELDRHDDEGGGNGGHEEPEPKKSAPDPEPRAAKPAAAPKTAPQRAATPPTEAARPATAPTPTPPPAAADGLVTAKQVENLYSLMHVARTDRDEWGRLAAQELGHALAETPTGDYQATYRTLHKFAQGIGGGGAPQGSGK